MMSLQINGKMGVFLFGQIYIEYMHLPIGTQYINGV